MTSPRPLQWHHLVRLVAVATSIVTARHLFAIGFHYPLLMLLTHLSIALALGGLEGRSDANTIQTRPHSWTTRAWQAIFAASIAVAILFAYHSFLHNRNTTLGVMILGLDWATVIGRTWKWLRQDKQSSIDMPLSTATFFLCIILVLWKENWLVGKGIEYLLVAVIAMTTARQIWRSGLVDRSFTVRNVDINAYGAGLIVCLPLASLTLLIMGWYNRRDFHISGRILWILLSIISGSISLATETRIKKFTSTLQEKMPLNTRADFTFGNPIFPWLVLIIVEIDNWLTQQRPSTTSGVQWLGFVIAYLTTVDIKWLASSAASAQGQASYIPIPNVKSADESTDATKTPTPEETEAMCSPDFPDNGEPSLLRHLSLAWHVILGVLALFLVFYSALGGPYVDPGRQSWDLDIVIAWYHEPIEQVIRTSQLALELPNVAGRKVRTIVYNKGNLNETDLEVNFPLESSLVIRRLENVGREGDTYISHVLDSQQDWASHTLFIQAEPHEPEYLQARLEDYLVARTGFLTLSHVRNFCPDCDACNDHSGWTADKTILNDVFSRSNPGKTCQDISLTYRGQFVVSAQRMKEANKELLQDLRAQLIEDDMVGYTLERAWGTLFQCPTISERCPTLLSGWIGNRVAVEDCQCLDA